MDIKKAFAPCAKAFDFVIDTDYLDKAQVCAIPLYDLDTQFALAVFLETPMIL